MWRGSVLSVLSDLDKFLGHARHLFKHLKSEWTRTAWVLEYANFIRFHQENDALWLEVQKHLIRDLKTKVAVGAVTLFAEQSFGLVAIPETLKWSVRELPAPVRLWVERYGNNVLMAKYPGTKLYLLLLRAMSQDEAETLQKIRNKVFPIRRPPKVTVANRKISFMLQLNQLWNQFSFVFFRLRFHIRQGVFYRIEAARWKQSIASLEM
jgi:hypothetical protein